MTLVHKNETPCGPAIACGAACITLDHKPGDPTSVDIVAAAIKRLFTRKPADADSVTSTSSTTDLHTNSRGATAQSHAL